jgi:anaerobic magnesium-protoporphyrin IX monomethyl ester cyclase
VKITFIYPDTGLGKFNQGIGYLSSVLKERGHQTDLIHLRKLVKQKEFHKLLSQNKGDLIAFSVSTNMFNYALKLASWVKKDFNLPVIFGGIHPTISPQEVIEAEPMDMVCIGEGEEALGELCDRLEADRDITNIRNIWVKRKNRIYKNEIRPLIDDLNSLPFPDRRIFDREALVEMKEKDAPFVMASRGCPYDCSYCCNHTLKTLYKDKGRYFRIRGVDNVLDEIEQLKAQYAFNNTIIFHDDIFPTRRDWLEEFSVKYRQRINLPFLCNLRPELASKDTVGLLRQAGCAQVSMGIESGNDYMRREVMLRNISRQKLIDSFSACKAEGIKVQSFNMVGLPFEDINMAFDTVKLNVELKPDKIQSSIFYPYPQTALYEVCRKQNFLTNKTMDNYFDESVLCLPDISARQIYFVKHYFTKMVKHYYSCRRLPRWLGIPLEKMLDLIYKSELNAIIYIIQRKFSRKILKPITRAIKKKIFGRK